MADLRAAGLSKAAIDAAWPSWWSDEIAASPSGRTELRFALARKLGLAPKALLGERVEFVWKDTARFKHLKVEDSGDQSILNSFGVSVGRLVLSATQPGQGFSGIEWLTLRDAILSGHQFVDLQNLIATCWALGVPVIQLRVFPLEAKRMHAMVIESGGRHAILIGRSARYPAPVAFTLAHEIGHIARQHLEGVSALVDVEDPALARDPDNEEREADAFSLAVLTGSESPEIQTSLASFNAPMLADAAIRASDEYRVEPGTLALCLAYRRNMWPVAMSSLRFIYGEPFDVGNWINSVADRNIDWSLISGDAGDYLRNLMQLDHA
jgi:hypothetical protein